MGQKSFGKVRQAVVTEWTRRGESGFWDYCVFGHRRDKAAVQGSCRQGGLEKRHFKGNDDDKMGMRMREREESGMIGTWVGSA